MTNQSTGQTFVLNSNENTLYTKRTASEYLGVCERTLELWLKKGLIGCVKPTHQTLRIRQQDLDRFLEKFSTIRTAD